MKQSSYDPVKATQKARAIMNRDYTAQVTRRVIERYTDMCRLMQLDPDAFDVLQLAAPTDKRNDRKFILHNAVKWCEDNPA